ncbi:MAG TPA: hypothetical protein VKT78_08295 [Fimbriimonadaceae bacterium]|nr:hypothetical protein [Fimbriimonadaceae bacterium]
MEVRIVFRQRLAQFVLLGSLMLPAGSEAAHWTLVSMGTSNYPYSPTGSGDYSDTVLGQTSVSIPSGNTYGGGTFQMYGDEDDFGFSTGLGFYGTQKSWSPVNSYTQYFKFEYKWVSDNPGDTPPGVGSGVTVNGYLLMHAEYDETVGSTTALVKGTGSDSGIFNSYGDIPAVWSWPSDWRQTQVGVSDIEPGNAWGSGYQVTTIGSNEFFIVDYAYGTQSVTMDGSDHVVIFYPLCDLRTSGSMTGYLSQYAFGILSKEDKLIMYQGAAQIGGLAVQ